MIVPSNEYRIAALPFAPILSAIAAKPVLKASLCRFVIGNLPFRDRIGEGRVAPPSPKERVSRS